LLPIVTMRIFDEPVVMVADLAGVGRWTTTISAVNGPWAVRPAVLTRYEPSEASAAAAATGSMTGAGEAEGEGAGVALGAMGVAVWTGLAAVGVAATTGAVAAGVGAGTSLAAGLTVGVELQQADTTNTSAAASTVHLAAVRRLDDMIPSARTAARASYQRRAEAPLEILGRRLADTKKRPAGAGRSAMRDRSDGPSDPWRVGGPQAIGSARGTS
jgi:hypothetical protein